MDGYVDEDDLDAIAGILCRPPGTGLAVTVINDDELFEPDDGTPVTPARVNPDPPKRPSARNWGLNMIELPSSLFNGRWLRQDLRRRLGDDACADFYEAMHTFGSAACEPVYLAAVLRKTYGTAGLPAIVDGSVFSQPVYAAFRDTVMPVLDQYIYR